MLTELSQLQPSQCLLLAVLCIAVTVIIGVGAVLWQRAWYAERKLQFKKELLDQGVTIEDMERLLAMGMAATPPAGSAAVAIPPARGDRAFRIIWAVFGGLALFMGVIMAGAALQSFAFWSNVGKQRDRMQAPEIPRETSPTCAEDLERFQGTWEYQQSDAAGKKHRATNEIHGSRDTLTVFGADGEVVYAHSVNFLLEQRDRFRIFHFSNLKVQVPPRGKIPFLETPKGDSFLYRIHGDTFTEVQGFQIGEEARPPSVIIWSRVKGPREPASRP